MQKKLNEYIESNFEELKSDLSAFISIPSVSEDLVKVGEALDFALKKGEEAGFDAKGLMDGQVGVIEMGTGDEVLGILTHVDVVPPGDLSEWKTDPFEATVIDGKMFGRGTLDDKGMIISALYAMKAVAATGIQPKKRVQLIMGTQEEVDWTDMYAYVEKYPLPDYGFTPDGQYPICNIEKGSCNVVLKFSTKDDCNDLRAVRLSCGVAENVVPGKAVAVLSDGREITASGKAVHSCQPEKGENAFFNLVDELEQMGVAENKLFALMKEMRESFFDIYGTQVDLYSQNEYYQGEFVHRNTFALTLANADENEFSININIRFAYGTEPKEIVDKLTDLAEKLGGTADVKQTLPAVFVSKDRPFLSVFAKAYEEVTGLENEFTLEYGGTYAKAMPNVVSWGPIFPGEEDTCHEVNEFIPLESLKQSTKIFAQVIAEILLSEKSFK